MKFMMLTYIPGEKMAEVSAASDRVWAKASPKKRADVSYMLMCHPFDVPKGCYVTFGIFEGDSAEEIAAGVYPMELAGATVQIVPLLEVRSGSSAKTEKKYRG